MNKQTNKKNYEIGSYEKDLAHYHKEKRIIQYLAIMALCLSVALVVWCLITTD